MSHSESSSSARPRLLDRCTHALRAAIFALPAWPFFLGLVLSFVACALAGRIVSERPLFENFVRFFAPIQPQRYFYPTASQLVAHIRHTVPPSKTLVLVGGASYFRGTGQNPGELWTLELQRRLGSRYAVVNFATDQADLTSFAAVAFEILAREYPKMVYVANGNVASAVPLDGGPSYRYVFWDAYYKGLLPPALADSPAVRDLRWKQLRDPAALEVHLGAWLDQFAYACDLWTYLGYKHAFTVWTDEHRFAPFQARRHEREGDDPNLALYQANTRRDAAYIKHSEEFAKNAAKTGLLQTAQDNGKPNPRVWTRFGEELQTMFPAELRPKCLVVLLRGNPFFMQTLTDEERRRTELIYQLGQEAYQRAGYQVVSLRAEDFNADDFIDGGHLMASGGAKVAKAVATHLEDLERSTERALPLAHPRAGAADIAVVLPSNRAPRQETLLSVWNGTGAEVLSVEYLGGETARLLYRPSLNAAPVFSPPFSAPNFQTVHALSVSLSSLYPRTVPEWGGLLSAEEIGTLKSWLLVRLDERPFWEVPVAGSAFPRGDIILGQVPRASASSTQFTGTFYLAQRRPISHRTLRRDEIGGGRLNFFLTEAMAGRAFPLATTGKPGAGNVLFLRVNANGNAVIGYDHWGTAPLLSPEITLGFTTPHTLSFQLPALAGAGVPPEIVVTLDGKIVWRQRAPFYRAAPTEIFFGQNPIGATSSEPALPNGQFENVLVPSWRG